MTIKVLGQNVDANAVAAQTAVQLTTSPFAPLTGGRKAAAFIVLDPGATAGSGVAKIQTSPDNSAWTDALTLTGLGSAAAEITLDEYVRLNVTGAYGAGSLVTAYLLASP